MLSEKAKQQIAACNDDLAKHEAERMVEVAKRDAKIERLGSKLQEVSASSAIRAALFECGVNGKHMGMALPYLVKKFSVEVSEDGATVSGQPVESAVATWLASEDGTRFAPKAATAPGPILSAVRQLRSHD